MKLFNRKYIWYSCTHLRTGNWTVRYCLTHTHTHTHTHTQSYSITIGFLQTFQGRISTRPCRMRVTWLAHSVIRVVLHVVSWGRFSWLHTTTIREPYQVMSPCNVSLPSKDVSRESLISWASYRLRIT